MKKNSKLRELFLYGVFGALTTFVNFALYYILEQLIKINFAYIYINAIAWCFAVLFAYVTNKMFVFESKSWKSQTVKKELFEFVVARLLSFGIEEIGLIVFVELLRFKELNPTCILNIQITGEFISKVILAVVVVVLNYFFSKFVIFKKEKTHIQ
ncbi:MAG: GtrA family protein [Treponemataceae bacterium]|nr:GtrA family protein [Treponemataceae bacterium]